MNLKKKLAVFLAILFSLNLFAQAPGETITISFQNIPLSEAIKKIESVSKYTFFYDALKLNVDQKYRWTPKRHLFNKQYPKCLEIRVLNLKLNSLKSSYITKTYPLMKKDFHTRKRYRCQRRAAYRCNRLGKGQSLYRDYHQCRWYLWHKSAR